MWAQLGRDAGFPNVRELFTDPTGMYTVVLLPAVNESGGDQTAARRPLRPADAPARTARGRFGRGHEKIWNPFEKSLVCRRVSTARTTAVCQAWRRDEFTAQFYCVIKGVVSWLVSRPRGRHGLLAQVRLNVPFDNDVGTRVVVSLPPQFVGITPTRTA